MEKNDALQQTLDIVKSHIARAREGKKLLQEGKSLNEITAPQVGFSEQEIRQQREAYIQSLSTKSGEELKKMLANVEKRIEKATGTELQVFTGKELYSEINWGSKNLSFPKLRFIQTLRRFEE